MSVARRNLKEAGGETRPRRTGIGYKANDRGVSRRDTVKPESYPDAAGVNPAGTAGKRQGLPWPKFNRRGADFGPIGPWAGRNPLISLTLLPGK